MSIEVENLVRDYGFLRAVNHVSFSVPKGAVLALIGPNGAGKTSLMKMIAGLLQPTSGKVAVDGETEARGIHGKLGYLPDFFGLYDDLTITQYLSYFAMAYGFEGATLRERVAQVIELVQLTGKSKSEITNLSRGMKQRVGIARTLINDPPVILLDEPSAGLDPEARTDLQELFIKLGKMGKTLLVSSHILTELEQYSTHIAILKKGKLVSFGALEELRQAKMASRLVTMRILEGIELLMPILEKNMVCEDMVASKNEVKFTFLGSDGELAELLKICVRENISVLSFGEHQGRIQSAYLSTLKRDAND
jgi:ABC-2 type transport system ATP-binding protein